MIDLNAPFVQPGDTDVERSVVACLNLGHSQPAMPRLVCPGCGAVFADQTEVRPVLREVCGLCQGYARRAVIADTRLHGVVADVLREWSDDKHGVTELSRDRVQALADLLEKISRMISDHHPLGEYAWNWANEIRRTWRPWP